MAKICCAENCHYKQFGGGYCKRHQWMRTDGKAPTTIAPVADKRARELEEYYKLRGPFLKEHPFCEIKGEGCTIHSTEVHHTAGRENGLLILVEFWKGSCRNCNRIVEIKTGWARELKHKVSKKPLRIILFKENTHL